MEVIRAEADTAVSTSRAACTNAAATTKGKLHNSCMRILTYADNDDDDDDDYHDEEGGE